MSKAIEYTPTPIEREMLNNELISYLMELGFSTDDIKSGSRIFRSLDNMQAWTDERIAKHISPEDILSEFHEITEAEAKLTHKAKNANEFGEDLTCWAWKPFLPIGEFSVLMASGGCGKTVLMCLIASYISRGESFPNETEKREPGRVLFISAEDRGEILKKRLKSCGANLDNIEIIDTMDSVGMNFTNNYNDFANTIAFYKPELVIIDPWYGFSGPNIDIGRVNVVRPIFQSLARMSKQVGCALVLISHENKRPQSENINNGALGSVDLINASRSAFKVIFSDDEGDENVRILVHTKSNYAEMGKSIRYKINESGGADWDGFSNITRSTLEEAANQHKKPTQLIKEKAEQEVINYALIKAVKEMAEVGKIINVSYSEFREKFGEGIFGKYQPKKALGSIRGDLDEYGITLEFKQVKHKGKRDNGVGILCQPLTDDCDEDENPFTD